MAEGAGVAALGWETVLWFARRLSRCARGARGGVGSVTRRGAAIGTATGGRGAMRWGKGRAHGGAAATPPAKGAAVAPARTSLAAVARGRGVVGWCKIRCCGRGAGATPRGGAGHVGGRTAAATAAPTPTTFVPELVTVRFVAQFAVAGTEPGR